jgi:nucleotide-binding universal stress UspA family protein
MHKVLVAHDLSPRSAIALADAARLVSAREGDLTILHVIDDALPPKVIEVYRTHAESHLASAVRQLPVQPLPPHRIEIILGDPAEIISAEAEARAVDLVVVGRHRRRPIIDMFTGTTVERLMRQARRPILVVCKESQSPYRRILVPVDFSSASTAAIRTAAALFPKAIVHLLHAYKGPFQDYIAALTLTFSRAERAKFAGSMGEQAEQAMSQLVGGLGLAPDRTIVTVKNGDAAALIQEELDRQEADLLAVGTHARSGIARALIGSVAESALASSSCNVLVVPLGQMSE